MATYVAEMRLFNDEGQKLYLSAEERKRFLSAADLEPREIQVFCHLLHYTGCRPSEALELSPSRILIEEKSIIFRTLKKRQFDNQGRKRKPQFRQVPVPNRLILDLSLAFDLRRLVGKGGKQIQKPLWLFSRATAWRRVKKVMERAGINGPCATSKGLRHGWGVAMIEAGVPITLVRDCLGHADLKTTEIYLSAVGQEKRNIVLKAWDK